MNCRQTNFNYNLKFNVSPISSSIQSHLIQTKKMAHVAIKAWLAKYIILQIIRESNYLCSIQGQKYSLVKTFKPIGCNWWVHLLHWKLWQKCIIRNAFNNHFALCRLESLHFFRETLHLKPLRAVLLACSDFLIVAKVRATFTCNQRLLSAFG